MSEGDVIRIAMWSGPRNLSTAMMRSFGNRPDTAVLDEPFYAAFLKAAGADHPMRDEVLSHHEQDWRKVAENLAGPVPDGKRVFYQKHMTHHMVPGIGRDWMASCRHAFLIRHPDRVLASYADKRGRVTLADIGFLEQAELYDQAAALMPSPPPVVDADRLLADPGGVLSRLCEALGIPFTDAMLSWPPGRRPTDGVWAAHWYDSVERSTGFAAASERPAVTDSALRNIAAEALPLYQRLAVRAIA
jgi:hypothetical protein